jgi:hypothetical protein
MAAIGLRDIIPSIDMFPVKKLSLKLDISGDTKEPIITNKHAVIGGSCNLFEVLTIPIDVPLDLMYSPVLTVYVYDHLMGFLGTRLLGITNIPLEEYCKKVQIKLEASAAAFMGKGLGSGAGNPFAKKSPLGGMGKLKNAVTLVGEQGDDSSDSSIVSHSQIKVKTGDLGKSMSSGKFAKLRGKMANSPLIKKDKDAVSVSDVDASLSIDDKNQDDDGPDMNASLSQI